MAGPPQAAAATVRAAATRGSILSAVRYPIRAGLSRLGRASSVAAVAWAWACLWASPARAGAILPGPPERIEPGGRYLFYLHGRIIEEQGPRLDACQRQGDLRNPGGLLWRVAAPGAAAA